MKQSTKTYLCKNCGTESKWSHQKTNIYCSKQCSSEGMLKETKQKFLSGLISNRKTLYRVLCEVNGNKCSCCGISEWNSKPLVLQVDHKDGNASNNMPDNLRLMCPNCHSQTETFGGANKGNGRASKGLPLF